VFQVMSQAAIDSIADELLAQARASKFGITDPSGVPVAHLYRCPDMARLPQGLQQQIVEKANQKVSANPWLILLFLSWLVTLVLMNAVDPTLASERLLRYTFPVLVPVLPLLLRAVMVRQAVKRIARQVAASWPVAIRL
jgi:hypothetical protein